MPVFALIMRKINQTPNPPSVMSLRRISFIRELLQGLCLALLIVIPCVLYARTLAFDFVNWDDDLYVYANPVIRAFTAEHIAQWFTRPFVSLYVPVPMASYALNFAFSGLDPGSYHAWNTAIHTVNSVLVFFIFYFFQKDIYLCFLCALLFAVHPVQVEAVAWVSQRKTLLAALFTLSGFYCFLHGYFAREKRGLLFAAASALFLLAVFSKVTAVMIPAVLLIYHFFYRTESGASRSFALPYLLAVPFVFAAFITLALYPGALRFLMEGTLFQRAVPWAAATVFYVSLILHPEQLDLRYPENLVPQGIPAAEGWLLAGAFCGLLLLILLTVKRVKPVFWIYWFLLFLLPASQIVAAPAGDRHLYLPLAGFLGLLLTLGSRWRTAALAVLGIWAVVLIPRMSDRLEIWQNSETLWKSVRFEGPHRINTDVQLAGYYEEQGRFAEAAEVYHAVLRRRPHIPYPYINAYNLYARLGRTEKAAEIAVLFQSQYSTAHTLDDVYKSLLARKGSPESVQAYLQEVMKASLFGLPGGRKA